MAGQPFGTSAGRPEGVAYRRYAMNTAQRRYRDAQQIYSQALRTLGAQRDQTGLPLGRGEWSVDETTAGRTRFRPLARQLAPEWFAAASRTFQGCSCEGGITSWSLRLISSVTSWASRWSRTTRGVMSTTSSVRILLWMVVPNTGPMIGIL